METYLYNYESYNFEKALAIDPRDINAREGLGMLLFSLKRYEEAGKAFESLLQADPNRNYAKGYLFQSRLYCCDWREFQRMSDSIVSDLSADKAVIIPMALTNFSRGATDQLQCAKNWIANKYPPSNAPMFRGEKYGHDRIRAARFVERCAGIQS